MRVLLLLAALLALALPARAQMFTPDFTGPAVTLGALNASTTLAVAGRTGASVALTGGTLNGTITPYTSRDGGASWDAAVFVTGAGATVGNISGAALAAQTLGILVPPGATHVNVKMSAWTSGSFTAVLRSTFNGAWGETTLAKHGGVPTTTAVSCATTATLAPASALVNRTSLCIQNTSATVVYVGGAGVTTANGMQLNPNDSFCDDAGPTPYYCIVAASTATVRALEN